MHEVSARALRRLPCLGHCYSGCISWCAGALVEEPGGYKALVFDQGDRITQAISTADVADICLRALHEPEARNKTFDVAYERSDVGGDSVYELVAHVPDKSNNYLRAAVQPLAKNT